VHQQDADAVRRQLAPDFLDHEMPLGTPPGPEAAVQYRAMLHTAFPDLRIQIDEMIAEGDRVAVRATWTGTHRGSMSMIPVPPSNRSVRFTGMVFWRIHQGRIAERWATVDRLGLVQQLTANA